MCTNDAHNLISWPRFVAGSCGPHDLKSCGPSCSVVRAKGLLQAMNSLSITH